MSREEELFDTLDVSEKQKRVRISEYTSVLYKSALKCQMEIQSIKAKTYLKEKYIDTIEKASLYTDCNKDNCIDIFEKLFLDYSKIVDAKITRIDEIQLLRKLFRKAIYIDNFILNSKSENPLTDLIRETILDADEDSELKLVFEISIHELKKVYLKHIDEINLVVVPEAFVRRKKKRPMMLRYDIKPYLNDLSRYILIAKPLLLDKKRNEMLDKDIIEDIQQNNMLGDFFSYFLYEAADMIKRLEAHNIYVAYMELILMIKMTQIDDIVDRYKQMLDDFDIDKNAIRLIASREDSENRDKKFMGTVKDLKTIGVSLRPMTDEDNHSIIYDNNQIIQILEDI